MADTSLLRAWWNRVCGHLKPAPCPFSAAGILECSMRSWFAGPQKILTAFGLTAGQCVLEIGPGVGFYSCEAVQLLGPAGRLICLDIQRDMLHETRRRIDEAGCTRAWFIQASAEALPMPSGSVDHVFLITVLGEIADSAKALREIHHVLRPRGRLSISEQFPDPDYVTPGTMRRRLGAAGFEEDQTSGRLVYTSTWHKVS